MDVCVCVEVWTLFSLLLSLSVCLSLCLCLCLSVSLCLCLSLSVCLEQEQSTARVGGVWNVCEHGATKEEEGEKFVIVHHIKEKLQSIILDCFFPTNQRTCRWIVCSSLLFSLWLLFWFLSGRASKKERDPLLLFLFFFTLLGTEEVCLLLLVASCGVVLLVIFLILSHSSILDHTTALYLLVCCSCCCLSCCYSSLSIHVSVACSNHWPRWNCSILTNQPAHTHTHVCTLFGRKR